MDTLFINLTAVQVVEGKIEKEWNLYVNLQAIDIMTEKSTMGISYTEITMRNGKKICVKESIKNILYNDELGKKPNKFIPASPKDGILRW